MYGENLGCPPGIPGAPLGGSRAFSFRKDQVQTRHEMDVSAFLVSRLEAFQDRLAFVAKDSACQDRASYHRDQKDQDPCSMMRQVQARERHGDYCDQVVLGDRPYLEGYHQGRFPLEGYSCPNHPPEPSPDHPSKEAGLLAVWATLCWAGQGEIGWLRQLLVSLHAEDFVRHVGISGHRRWHGTTCVAVG